MLAGDMQQQRSIGGGLLGSCNRDRPFQVLILNINENKTSIL